MFGRKKTNFRLFSKEISRDDIQDLLFGLSPLLIFMLVLFILFFLSACSGEEIVYKPVKTDIPLYTLCHSPKINKPKFASETTTSNDTLFDQIKSLIVTDKQRQAYEAKLIAANKSCN